MLTLILLCRDRVEFADRAVQAVLNQSNCNYKLIVSDNSTNRKIKDLIEKKYPDISYILNYPDIPVFDHFNRAISSVKTKYFSLLHDDDVILPDYVDSVLRAFEFKAFAAVATNGVYLNYDGSNAKISKSFSGDKSVEFNNVKELLMRYLKIGGDGAAPFSSYAYSSAITKGLQFNFNKGRYYCDTVFLLETVERGNILWIKEPLVGITVHSETNTEASGVRDYKSFISYIKRAYPNIVQSKDIEEYRFMRLLWVLRKKRKYPNKIIIYYLIKWSPYLLIKSKFFRKKFLNLPIRFIRAMFA